MLAVYMISYRLRGATVFRGVSAKLFEIISTAIQFKCKPALVGGLISNIRGILLQNFVVRFRTDSAASLCEMGDGEIYWRVKRVSRPRVSAPNLYLPKRDVRRRQGSCVVSEVGSHSDRGRKSAPPISGPPLSAEPLAIGVIGLGKMQTRVFENVLEANRRWLDRVRSEADLAVDLAAKLTNARSLPDSTAAYNEWARRRFDLAAQDAEIVLSGPSKIVELGASLLSNGPGGGR